MRKNLFITATDTDAGKTYVAVELTKNLVKLGYKVAVYKPISAGCQWQDDKLINDDAWQLKQASNCQQPYEQINPIAYEEPIAPHIAAKMSGRHIDIEQITAGFSALQGDINLVEGAGGWRLPLGNGDFLSDFVKQAQLPVLLVVNMKLGCLNHAVLTYQSIINDGLTCVGWVANNQENMPYLSENINELRQLISAPCIGVINHNDPLTAVTGNLLAQI